MALIKLTAFIDQISGKVNGSVFARNKGGNYVRGKGNPTNPKTQAQSLRRAVFSAISSAWRALTQEQRNAWNAAAPDFPYTNRLGDAQILSGFALHQKLNTNLDLAGIAERRVAPPSPQGVGSAIMTSSSYAFDNDPENDVGVLQLNVEGSTQNAKVLVYATSLISPGVSNFQNRLRFLGAYPVQALNPTLVNFTDAYQDVFGSPADEGKIGMAVRMVNTSTGEASPMSIFPADVITL